MSGPKGRLFWLGTDHKGRDILSRLVWGSQRVLVWATLATAVAYVVGMLMGVAAGYLGGWWDEVISFFGNVLLSFPVMVLYLIIIGQLGSSGANIVLAVTFASAPGIMRIVRGLVLDLKTRDYIFAAQTRGEPPWHIMLVELLPNARGPLDRRCLPAARLHDDHHRHPGLPRPGPAAARPRLGPDDRRGRAGRHVRRPRHDRPGAAPSRRWCSGFNLLADGLAGDLLKD